MTGSYGYDTGALVTRRSFTLPSALAVWVLLACLLVSPARAAIDVTQSPGQLDLGPHVQLLEDAERELDIADLLARDETLPWRPSGQETINFSFSDSAWWLQVELANAGENQVRRLLELAMPLHDYLDAWVVDEAGEVVEAWQTGDRRAFDSRPAARPCAHQYDWTHGPLDPAGSAGILRSGVPGNDPGGHCLLHTTAGNHRLAEPAR